MSSVCKNAIQSIKNGNWAIEGCLEWQREGLHDLPEPVLTATQDYRNESDAMGRFLEEETEKTEDEQIRATRLYEAYKKWCQEQGEETKTQTPFGVEMKGRVTKRGCINTFTISAIMSLPTGPGSDILRVS